MRPARVGPPPGARADAPLVGSPRAWEAEVEGSEQSSFGVPHGIRAPRPPSGQPPTHMIRLDNISKQHGQQILFIEASAALHKGEKVGLVGPNGAGKTTLFRMITDQEHPDEGQVAVDRGVTIGYFNQDVGEMSGRSAVAEVMDGAGPVSSVAGEMKSLEADMADPDKADDMEKLVERYGLVQALLDEPSNHLDLESLIWLEGFLKGYEGALLMTSHDREFLNRIVTKMVEIDGGSLTTYSGNYDFYEQQRAQNEKQQQAQYERQQAMLAKELKFIERFKARASHAAQVQSRVKKLDKIERVEPPRRRQSVQFEFRSPPRSGDDVASFRNVHKGYGGQPIYAGFDFRMRRKERWCVLGANGAGKSTLLKLVAGAAEPDQGTVTVGSSVRMGYFAQHSMDLLDGDETVFESLDGSFPQAGQGALRSLAGCFGFSGDDIEKPCRVLSGGEKARLVMAKMLYDPPNFLVLDEPTNHLDMATKEMLVAALAEFEGTMLFVSHDRHFLAALSNRTLELTPDGVHQYGGGYTEYVARTGQEAPGLHPGG